MSSTYTDKSRCTNKHSQFLKIFPTCVLIRLFRAAFPITVKQVDDQTDFVQEERLGLPVKTKISATSVVVDVSRCQDVLTSVFSIELVRLPFWLGYTLILRLVLVLRILVALLSSHPPPLQQSFGILTNPVQWRQHMLPNRFYCVTYEYHSAFTWDRVPTPNSWDDKCQTVLPSLYASWMTSILFLNFVSGHAGIFSSFSHYLSIASFGSGIFSAWGIGIDLYTRLKLPNELNPFSAISSSWFYVEFLKDAACWTRCRLRCMHTMTSQHQDGCHFLSTWFSSLYQT